MIGSMSAGAKKHTCIKYKRNAFAGMEEYNRSGGTPVIPLKLHRRAIVRVVGEVEEDFVLCCARHVVDRIGGTQARSYAGTAGRRDGRTRLGPGGDRSSCGEEGGSGGNRDKKEGVRARSKGGCGERRGTG